jgi:peptide/nickel transport system substrate-binding protein
VGEPSKSFVSKLTWGKGPQRDVYQEAYDALPSVDQDLAQAKKLVAEAGAPTAPIVIASSPLDPAIPVLANEVQAAAGRIGLKAEIKTIPADSYGALFGDAKAREGIDLFYTTFYADIADPLEIYAQTFTSTAFSNYAGWKNATYDALITKGLGEADPVKRAQITVQAQKIAVDELLWLPIALTSNTLFLNKRITGTTATNAYVYYPWAAELGAAR